MTEPRLVIMVDVTAPKRHPYVATLDEHERLEATCAQLEIAEEELASVSQQLAIANHALALSRAESDSLRRRLHSVLAALAVDDLADERHVEPADDAISSPPDPWLGDDARIRDV